MSAADASSSGWTMTVGNGPGPGGRAPFDVDAQLVALEVAGPEDQPGRRGARVPEVMVHPGAPNQSEQAEA
jgi:hypothetical protein